MAVRGQDPEAGLTLAMLQWSSAAIITSNSGTVASTPDELFFCCEGGLNVGSNSADEMILVLRVCDEALDEDAVRGSETEFASLKSLNVGIDISCGIGRGFEYMSNSSV